MSNKGRAALIIIVLLLLMVIFSIFILNKWVTEEVKGSKKIEKKVVKQAKKTQKSRPKINFNFDEPQQDPFIEMERKKKRPIVMSVDDSQSKEVIRELPSDREIFIQ